MWAYGLETTNEPVCYTPTRDEIHPQTGTLRSYRSEDGIPAGTDDAKPMDDLYVLLWCFERIEAGLAGGALDQVAGVSGGRGPG
jgi:hypothetical protein